jgi:hypothetical protein
VLLQTGLCPADPKGPAALQVRSQTALPLTDSKTLKAGLATLAAPGSCEAHGASAGLQQGTCQPALQVPKTLAVPAQVLCAGQMHTPAWVTSPATEQGRLLERTMHTQTHDLDSKPLIWVQPQTSLTQDHSPTGPLTLDWPTRLLSGPAQPMLKPPRHACHPRHNRSTALSNHPTPLRRRPRKRSCMHCIHEHDHITAMHMQ